MQDVVEDSVGFLLRLVRMMAQHPLQCLKVRVSQRGDARRKSWRDVGSEKMEIVKGPLNALEDMPRNAPQEVVSKAIVCAKKSSSNRTIVPAGGAMMEERSPSRERPGREETRMLQDSVQPERVTREALNMAAKLQHKMERAERRPICLS